MSFFPLFDNPVLRREWHTRWRDGRATLLVGALALLLSWGFWRAYADFGALDSSDEGIEAWSRSLWRTLSWAGTAFALVLAPSLTGSSLALERERGLLEGLQLSPLRPFQIALGKWTAALAFALVVWSVAFPVSLLLALFGRVSPGEFAAVWGFQWLTLAFAGAVGIGCSAWAVRAHLALHSAYGVLLLWLLSSLVAAFASGDIIGGAFPGFQASDALRWWGRTNAILAAFDLVREGAPGFAKWPTALWFMIGAGVLCLWAATAGVKRPLEPAPLLNHNRSKRRKVKGSSSTKELTKNSSSTNDSASKRSSTNVQSPVAPGHFEMPLFGAWRFHNPVLGREVRGKFRLRLPSVAVLAAEAMLAVLVGGFYFYLLYLALTDDSTRPAIFWGVAYTGLIVTMMACGVMGANGFSREREGGTWEGVRLSLLSPREILAGKIGGSLLTALLFSLPVWPLLLACVRFDTGFAVPARSANDAILLSQLGATLLVWLGSMLLSTMWGLQIGEKSARSSTASGVTLGLGLALLVAHLVATLVTQDTTSPIPTIANEEVKATGKRHRL